MAIILIKKYELDSLRITLDNFSLDDPKIVLSLSLQSAEKFETAEIYASELNLPPRISTESDLHHFSNIDITKFAPGLCTLLEEHRVGDLWLHIVRPSGYLGGLPWERQLVHLAKRVLRVPEVIADWQNHQTNDINIAICLPFEFHDSPDLMQLYRSIDTLPYQLPEKKISLDIFCTNSFKECQFEKSENRFLHLRVHYFKSHERKEGERKDLWFSWIKETLENKRIDLVQFWNVGLHDAKPYLLFSNKTHAEKSEDLELIDARELKGFLSDIGAWAVSFTAVDEQSEFVVRYFADIVGQHRYGPTFFLSKANCCYEQAYQILFSELDVGFHFEQSFLYCQPLRFDKSFLEKRAISLHSKQTTELLRSMSMSEVDATSIGVLAKTNRYLEEARYRLAQLADRDKYGEISINHADRFEAEDTLDEIEKALKTLARMRFNEPILEAETVREVEFGDSGGQQ